MLLSDGSHLPQSVVFKDVFGICRGAFPESPAETLARMGMP